MRRLPSVREQEIADIAMLYAVSAHVEFIEREDIFRVVVAHIIVRSTFPRRRFFRSEKIGDLNIDFCTIFILL